MEYIQQFLDYEPKFLINDGTLPPSKYDTDQYCVEKKHKYIRLATDHKKEEFGQMAFFINDKNSIYSIHFDGHKHVNKVKKALGIDIQLNSEYAQDLDIKNIIPLIKALIDKNSILVGEIYLGKNYFRFNLQN